jgi:hypothetical protein
MDSNIYKGTVEKGDSPFVYLFRPFVAPPVFQVARIIGIKQAGMDLGADVISSLTGIQSSI